MRERERERERESVTVPSNNVCIYRDIDIDTGKSENTGQATAALN